MRVSTPMPALGPFSTTLAVTIDMEGLPDTGLDTSAWTAGTLPPLVDIVDVNDLQIAAKNTLAGADYAYYRTAALDEVTYNANLFIWEKIRLNGFSFAADVSDGNLTPSILGHEFNAPFFIAPATQAGRGGPGAETNLVQAAGAAGILLCGGHELAVHVSSGVHLAQPLSAVDRVQQMEAAGFKPVFLTVDDTGVNGIHDGQMRFSAGGDAVHSATFMIDALDQIPEFDEFAYGA